MSYQSAILARLEAANEALAAKRSQETYLRMIDVDKATEELLELDEARRMAREALRIVAREGLEGSDVVGLADRDGSFVTGPDGCVVFWPEENRGAFNSWHLRSIADELDRRNTEWFAQMDAFFAAQGIEAPSGGETRSGSTEGKSPVAEGHAPEPCIASPNPTTKGESK